ncbi:MAG: glutamate--tRNA ligase, partial [Pseudomonadota bacterium]
FKKLENVSGHHIANMPDAALLQSIAAYQQHARLKMFEDAQNDALSKALYCVKERAKTLPDLLEKAHFILTDRPLEIEEKAQKHLNDVSRGILSELTPHLQTATWSRNDLEETANAIAAQHELNFGKLAGPLRAALAGRAVTPSVFDMMLVLGREETVARINAVTGERG